MALKPAQIASDARAFGLGLDDTQAGRLAAFAELLKRWSKVYNLTAIDDDDALLTHHVLDSLSVVPELRAVLDGRSAARLLDVGSGGGLPAVPLAIAIPELHVTAVDKVRKKTAFITHARLELGLDNLDAVHRRVETWTPPLPFDVIVSRAFSALPDFVALTRHLLAADGRWIAMKGRRPDDEIEQLKKRVRDVSVERVATLRVPRMAAERHLVLLRVDQAA